MVLYIWKFLLPKAYHKKGKPLQQIPVNMYKSLNIQRFTMLRVGHRGARAYEPENTLRSFKKALEIGVNAIELDVRRTKDNQLVVIHDADVKRTTNGKGIVSELTLDEIKEFSTAKDEKIPTLKEALNFLDSKVKILLELKEEGIEEQVLAAIREKGLQKKIIIVSFLEEVLRKIRESEKEVETGLIYVKHKNPLKTALDLKANYLLPLYRFTHTANVQKAHENGLKVIVWTINNPEEVAEYMKKGVDGIASDKPDILTP
jgi:glycerophosphoryl diester phosphodiesterase